MSASKYNDIIAVTQVIGCVFNDPSLLDLTDKYKITEEDFDSDFHKICFGCLYKLHELGSKKITLENITDYLSSRPKSEGVFKLEKGEEWMMKVSENALAESFAYYYSRLKKMSLLRAYDKFGIDVKDIYDPDNIFDSTKKELQEAQLDNLSLEDIANKINDKIEQVKEQYVDQVYGESHQAGEGIYELIENLKKTPEVGIPMYGPYINTVTRGARLRKFYLRSAPTGQGKSRAMVADACYFACDKIFDETVDMWISNGSKEPTLYITTEQDLGEIQTMMLAFLSNVDEEHIINGTYQGNEEANVMRAAQLIAESPLFVEELPDFSLQDIEDIIKRNIRDKGVKYICLDYIHSSLKILEEVSKKTGVKLREDNILFMLAIRLKDLCNRLGVFILSSTQLNADWQTSETPDQNLLRGAKSIADLNK